MPDALEAIAYCLPLTYAIDALNQVTGHTSLTDDAWRDLWVILGCIVAAVLLAALTLKRQTK